MNSIAKKLTDLRLQNKLSQVQVAKIMGVTPALISAYEKAERKPSIDKLVLLADIYHTTTDYILSRTNAYDASIMLDVSKLSDSQINIIRDLIKELE